jgi:hypothetical protein
VICWRDRRRDGARIPACLAGCADVTRVQLADGDAIVAVCAAWHLGSPDVAWSDLGDGWDVGLVDLGDDPLAALARTAPGLPALTVKDAVGRGRLIPAVLDPAGAVALPLALGIQGYERIEGEPIPRWGHTPTRQQARLIQVATTVREALAGGTFAAITAAQAADMTASLLAATYHVTPAVLGTLGLLDDSLVVRALLACAGQPTQATEHA